MRDHGRIEKRQMPEADHHVGRILQDQLVEIAAEAAAIPVGEIAGEQDQQQHGGRDESRPLFRVCCRSRFGLHLSNGQGAAGFYTDSVLFPQLLLTLLLLAICCFAPGFLFRAPAAVERPGEAVRRDRLLADPALAGGCGASTCWLPRRSRARISPSWRSDARRRHLARGGTRGRCSGSRACGARWPGTDSCWRGRW